MDSAYTLSNLPNEIQLKIIGFVRYHSILTLRRVSHHFRHLITVADLVGYYDAEKLLLANDEIERLSALQFCCESQKQRRGCRCSRRCPSLDDHGALPCYTCVQ